MRILAISDIHGDSSLARRVADETKNKSVDLIVIAGDITSFNEEVRDVIRPFKELNKPILLIPGNHETNETIDLIAEYYGAINLHGNYFCLGDVGFFGAGGANIGPIYNITNERLYSLLKKSFNSVKRCKKRVMITHVHPKGSLMEHFSHIVPGSEVVTSAIYTFKPDVMFCGHVHEASGLEEKIGNTKVFNVSKIGKIIEV